MSSPRRIFVAVAAALALVAPLSAQDRATADPGVAPASSSMRVTASSIVLTPNVESATVDFLATEATTVSSVVLPQQARQTENVAMMIVGGAALVVGSLIDGDTGTIVMVSGGVVGLIGLFRYLR